MEDKGDEWKPENEEYKIFNNEYDHHYYGGGTIEKEFGEITVLNQEKNKYIKHPGTGRRCQPFDWVAVHWTSKMDNLGHPK